MKHSTFDSERRMQPFMDAVYKSWGFIVSRSRSCKKFDAEVYKPENGDRLAIEEKYNFIPATTNYDQMIVEIIQDLPSGDLGWYYHCEAQWLMWAYCPDNYTDPPLSFYIIQWLPLKNIVTQSIKDRRWVNMGVVTAGYGVTINYPVKFKILTDARICTKYIFDDFRLPFTRIKGKDKTNAPL